MNSSVMAAAAAERAREQRAVARRDNEGRSLRSIARRLRDKR
jgi:hypothetical protein